MKNVIALFALVLLAGSVGCSSAPKQQEEPATPIETNVDITESVLDDSFSPSGDLGSEIDLGSGMDTAPTFEPAPTQDMASDFGSSSSDLFAPAPTSSSTQPSSDLSLGASSSGRGH